MRDVTALATVERLFPPILKGRYSRCFTSPSVTFKMTGLWSLTLSILGEWRNSRFLHFADR
jgi:hypothetical protein